MRRITRFALAALCAAGLGATAVLAHHSTNGIYNEDETVELTGTVNQWRFVNPHPSLLIDVVGDDGATQQWDVSYGGSAVTHLRRRGYTAETFQPGDVIVVRGFAARVNGSFGLLVRGDPTTEDGAPIIESER